MKFDDATQRQVEAAAPGRSTWLTANAGSGKTRVLTNRVARLLFEGANPQHILCLTYTKAAAGEMQNRLFQTLGEWAMCADDDLRGRLEALGIDGPFDGDRLAQARRLFARAIETPGGLKIQTIHAFCSSLLRRFPREAGVSPQFTEMDDRSAEVLRGDVLDDMVMGEDRALVDRVAFYLTDSSFDGLVSAIMNEAETFAAPWTVDQLAKATGGTPGASSDDLLLDRFDTHLADSFASAFKGTGKRLEDAVIKVQAALKTSVTTATFPALAQAVLRQDDGAPKHAFLLNKAAKEMAAAEDFIAFCEDVAEAQTMLKRQRAFERTHALYAFASRFVPLVQDRQHARGMLSFDDLITRALELLTDPAVAQWVLWRLDGGIDHILLDEAQDTSPKQWAVMQRLAEEFGAGEGARAERVRTVFVVGDKKQSIYSFQGADPAEFDRMRGYFDDLLSTTAAPLATSSLTHSFRSSAAILSLVDHVFGADPKGLGEEAHHIAFKDRLPGRVDIWEPMADLESEGDEVDWRNPTDMVSPLDAKIRLARHLAAELARMIREEKLPEEQNGTLVSRPITEGDMLILVRRRDPLFHAIITACKQAGLRVAGADRLKLAGEMAVRDITALLTFLTLPEDDLSLAAALRSPLFGWSEQALYSLAQPRKGYLWQALREQDTPAKEMLDDLLAKADYIRPFDLISRILTRYDGRERLLARLGQEAEEGIDALLAQALIYEQGHVPSLTGFLVWLAAEDVEVKRQLDSNSNAIRVMTVHGSKGLEAPIVVMPDTGVRQYRDRAPFLRRDDTLLWPGPDAPADLDNLKASRKELDEEENRRLLYVAMTRAERWLIVARAGTPKDDEKTWYSIIRSGADEAQMVQVGGHPALRLSHGDWDQPKADRSTVTDQPDPRPLPELPAVPERPKFIRPSDMPGAKVMPGDPGEGDRTLAMRRGSALHLLLERLPLVIPSARMEAASRLIGEDPALADLPETALRLLSDPSLAPLFAPDSLAEAEITATIDGRPLIGAIDRLIVEPNRVLAVDFKSYRVAPETAEQTPDGILAQMGAYAVALEQIFPDRQVETAILWTETGQVLQLPHDLVVSRFNATRNLT